MEQRAVFLQTTRAIHYLIAWLYNWTRHFFTEDGTSDSIAIADLQRRSVWIGIALIFQGLNEGFLDWPFLNHLPFSSLFTFVLLVGSFVAMFIALRPATLQQRVQYAQRRARPWQRVTLVLTTSLLIATAIYASIDLVMCFQGPQFTNDGTSLDTNAAMLLVEGRNPYTDSNMLDLARKFPIEPNWTTPLQQGQFAHYTHYPNPTDFKTVLDTDLKAGTAPEFESKVSYPSLSFLTLVPFALFHSYNVLPFYLLSYLLLVFIAMKVARPEMRPWVLLFSLENVPMIVSAGGGNLDIFYTLLIVLTWLLRDRRWASALFLGLALSSKQLAWFFIPFYVIMVFRHYGLKENIARLTIAGSVALAFNLPFILWNPQAWIAGVLAPVVDPMFPMGIGIVNLSLNHLIPLLPKTVYTLLEAGVMLVVLVWYWPLCKKHPEAAMLLAVLPLFFAWRSLSSYFYCAAYPLFVLMVAKIPASRQTEVTEVQEMPGSLAQITAQKNVTELSGIPTSLA
ncbi:MAG: glycosyltransferase 87 family protein [Chloroflexota bacterium]|nr:glycosyltransferase 87 family protein [Chloroflexota bacterium]